jgi:hypothetical protein
LRTNTDILTDAFGMLEAGTTRIDGHLMNGMLVTGDFFQVLGAAPTLGRALMPLDDVDDGASSCSVTEGGNGCSHQIRPLWTERYA